MVTTVIDQQQEARRDELANRLFQTCLTALDIWGVYIGHHLGLYAALAGGQGCAPGGPGAGGGDAGAARGGGAGAAAAHGDSPRRRWGERCRRPPIRSRGG